MHLIIVGADHEENLGLGLVAALAESVGWSCAVARFDDATQLAQVVTRVIHAKPDVVGLGIQFQHRAHEFLTLARALRRAGFRGHLTAGGQWPSQAWRETLAPRHQIDSVVLFEAEETLPELLRALEGGGAWHEVPGLAFRNADGLALQSGARGLVEDLDAVPFPKRYRPHDVHFGVPFIPVMASRGCWGQCAYCSITSGHRDAHAHGGGRRLRRRSPPNVAEEMAALWHRAGGPSIFCFHDDNFLEPRPKASRARIQAIRDELDALGVGDIGIVAKCRPDSLDRELAKWLAEQGVLRLYVGVENASEAGSYHLGRGTQGEHVDTALAACREAGIFVCYNLLLFEPQSTLQDLADNVAFIRAHPDHPVNFCRAEPYYGTPLMRCLEEEDNLTGSYLGYDYRIQDDHAELTFRLTSAIFRDRNFSAQGVANRYMGLGYATKVLERFHTHAPGWRDELSARAAELTRSISLETASLLEDAMMLVEHYEPRGPEWFEGAAAHLGLRIAEIDGQRHAELDALLADIRKYAEVGHQPRRPLAPPEKVARVTRALALGATLALGSVNAGCEDETMVLDPLPSDSGFVVDPLPADSGVDAGQDAGTMDAIVVDPLPPDAGVDAGEDAGVPDVPPVDPPPPDAGLEDLGALGPVDRWRDTTPRRVQRSRDLPLYDIPELSLTAVREGDAVTATVRTEEPASLRWQARGHIEGNAETVTWYPADDKDRLVVAARCKSGLALASVRARQV